VMRFTREARIVQALHHANIVRLYATGQDQGHLYFAMEYFAGQTAGQLLKQRGRLDVGSVIEIAAQAADALHHAHTYGHLVHRDIKPENLLVDRWCRVKVLDFGLARIEGVQSITKAGTVVGSLYYVAVEQLLGRPIDGRADVYSLGVSMYEMLTGRRPYRGRTLNEMTEAIISGKAPAPSQLEPSVPAALDAIIYRAMERDLARRYASAEALRQDLRALQAQMATPPATPSGGGPAEPPRPPDARNAAR
ncbi:MAG TPA: serine/threonine-protein kinase, partial [Ktedonobacterales bacterium]|nr:serine/threonine-protein kinase [Ktedonobacterales bacterium]